MKQQNQKNMFVSRFPPYYCVLNPIELVSSKLKDASESVVDLIGTEINNINCDVQNSFVKHVIKVGDSHLSPNSQEFIINVADGDNDSDFGIETDDYQPYFVFLFIIIYFVYSLSICLIVSIYNTLLKECNMTQITYYFICIRSISLNYQIKAKSSSRFQVKTVHVQSWGRLIKLLFMTDFSKAHYFKDNNYYCIIVNVNNLFE